MAAHTKAGGQHHEQVGEGILRRLEQALAFANGTADESQYKGTG